MFTSVEKYVLSINHDPTHVKCLFGNINEMTDIALLNVNSTCIDQIIYIGYACSLLALFHFNVGMPYSFYGTWLLSLFASVSASSFCLFNLLALTLAAVLEGFIKGMELDVIHVKEDTLNPFVLGLR